MMTNFLVSSDFRDETETVELELEPELGKPETEPRIEYFFCLVQLHTSVFD